MAISEQSVRAIWLALTDFGYEVDIDYVRAEVARLVKDDEQAIGGPPMMIAEFLYRAGIRQRRR